MKSTALIDAIVQQTTVLIAQLATTAGIRAPLSHLANQVFLDLVTELEAQGVGRKVVADMFGLALRTYQRKVQRISESLTERNRTLWEAVLIFIQKEQVVRRARLFERFSQDDENIVRSVLRDLVESGLVYRTGRGDGTIYRAADSDEIGHDGDDEAESNAAFVWLQTYLHQPIDLNGLITQSCLTKAVVEPAIKRLIADGRIEQVPTLEPPTFQCANFILKEEPSAGWETALFHHYQALVSALCLKLSGAQSDAVPKEAQGGSTYSFKIWDGHPQTDEIYGLLSEFRSRLSALRTANTTHNERVGRPKHPTQVTFYMGQSVVLGDLD